MNYKLLIFSLSAGLILSACSAESSPRTAQSTSQQPTEAPPVAGDIALPIEGEFTPELQFDQEGSEARALNAAVGVTLNGRLQHGITLPNQFPVVAIVRSSANDPASYFYLRAVKTSGSRYRVQQERVRLDNRVRLAQGKKWYIMFVAGGSINPGSNDYAKLISAPKVSVDASASESVTGIASGSRSGMDFVMATDWIEVPTWSYGDPKWPKDWTPAERNRQRGKLYPIGVLCRATLRLDDDYKKVIGNTATTVNVTQLKVVSTGLSFKGSFDLSHSKLPALVKPTGQRVPKLDWTNTQTAASSKDFVSTDASVAEYTKVFTGNPVLSVSGTQNSSIFASNALPSKAQSKTIPTGMNALIFWAMPVPGVSAAQNRTTLIAETGTVAASSGTARVLAPSYTYIYGKQHSKVAVSGSSVYFDAVYYHPLTPLDYMAEYNMARLLPNQWVIRGRIPMGISNAWATDHGRNAFAAARMADVGTLTLPEVGGRNFQVPTQAQWESVIPFQNTDIRVHLHTQQARNANAVLNVQLGDQTGTARYTAFKTAGSDVMYAIALEGFQGGNKRRVAYRYQMVPNPTQDITSAQGLHIPFSYNANTQFGQGLDVENRNRATNFSAVASNTVVMRVEAIQLGSQFVGSVRDIANDAFWSSSKRIERRFIPMAYDMISISTSAGDSYFTQRLQTFYTFSDQKGFLMGFSRRNDAFVWTTYQPKEFVPRGGAESTGPARMRQIRITVRPFTSAEHGTTPSRSN